MELENKVYLLHAPWCSQCPAVKSQIESREMDVEYVDIDKNPEVAANLGVMSIPTFVDNRNEDLAVYSGAGPCMNFMEEIY